MKAKKVGGQRLIFIATAMAIAVAALWAVLFVPRLDIHPQAIKDGVDSSSKMFFSIQWLAAAVLIVCVILSLSSGRIISGVLSGLLYLAAGLLSLHDFMVFNGAVFYLQNYEGFFEEAILMLACVVANLIALILAIKSGNRYRKLIKARGGEEALP
jgi:uncharacterized membrane protein